MAGGGRPPAHPASHPAVGLHGPTLADRGSPDQGRRSPLGSVSSRSWSPREPFRSATGWAASSPRSRNGPSGTGPSRPSASSYGGWRWSSSSPPWSSSSSSSGVARRSPCGSWPVRTPDWASSCGGRRWPSSATWVARCSPPGCSETTRRPTGYVAGCGGSPPTSSSTSSRCPSSPSPPPTRPSSTGTPSTGSLPASRGSRRCGSGGASMPSSSSPSSSSFAGSSSTGCRTASGSARSSSWWCPTPSSTSTSRSPRPSRRSSAGRSSAC